MTISTAIRLLQALLTKHGDVEVYYDCDHCGKSTKPDAIVAQVQLKPKAEPLTPKEEPQ